MVAQRESQDARDRHLQKLSMSEKATVSEIVAAPLESEWVWLLNAGVMEARQSMFENLPGTPVQVVEVLGKPYALIQYTSPTKAAAAVTLGAQGILLAPAAIPIVNRILAGLKPTHPEPHVSTTSPTTHTFPNGLILIHDFITPDEEADLVHQYHLTADAREGRALKRGALHFGPHFDYTTFAPSASAHTPPPAYLTRLLDRLPLQGERDIPDQFTVQYYPPRTGIPPHVDTHSAFEETLCSLSFGASIPMDFRRCGKKEARRMRLPKRSLGNSAEAATPASEILAAGEEEEHLEEWTLDLPRRSLLVMTGASRFGFTHGIKGRSFDQDGTRIVSRGDRYSVTMRRVKPLEEVRCDCAHPHVCDWRIRQEREGVIS